MITQSAARSPPSLVSKALALLISLFELAVLYGPSGPLFGVIASSWANFGNTLGPSLVLRNVLGYEWCGKGRTRDVSTKPPRRFGDFSGVMFRQSSDLS